MVRDRQPAAHGRIDQGRDQHERRSGSGDFPSRSTLKPKERSAEVEAELVTVIAGAATAYPEAQVTVRRILVVEPLTPIPVGQRLTGLLCQNATRIMGEKVGTEGVPLYTDAWH